MKIDILLTGGTIGSKVNGSNSVVDLGTTNNTSEALLRYYYEQRPESDVGFDLKSVVNVLSENISPRDWWKIYSAVTEIINTQKSDGIIITHGTDTLAYTSAFLALMISGASIPVILVSSDLPLDDIHANGYKNFLAAVDLIVNERITGVLLPIYEDGITHIHLGSRLTQARPFTHRFRSLSGVYFGIMDEKGFHRNEHKYNPTLEDINGLNCPDFLKRIREDSLYVKDRNIIYIKPFPGLNYNMFNFTAKSEQSEKPDAVLHELYHSGTACVNISEPQYSIIHFAKMCINDGIDFYAAPFDSQYAVYITSKEMRDVGIRFISDMTAEAAYIKLNIAYGLYSGPHSDRRKIEDFINYNIAFEKLF